MPNMKYIPEDFYAAFGITEADLEHYVGCCADFTWQELCTRAADAANAKLNKEAENRLPREMQCTLSDMLALLVRVQKLESEIERMKK